MSKKLEAEGFKYLEEYVRKNLPDAKLRPTMNKGRGESNGIGDAVLEYEGKTFHIEMKIRSKEIGTNIRFTHQTISKALKGDLIVALICNLSNCMQTSVTFFRLGSVQRSILVEPHFIIQQKSIKDYTAELSDLLKGAPIELDLSDLLTTEVQNHIRL